MNREVLDNWCERGILGLVLTMVLLMPLVFGGAPLVNVLVSMWMHPPKAAPSPLLYLGFLLAAAGAGMVLYYKPA